MEAVRISRWIAETIFPEKALLVLWFFYGLVKAPVKSFSQKGEDLLVRAYFDHLGMKGGTYCDIGCFHPVWMSNTHLFDKAGWRGFAVDVDDFKLRAMRLVRKGRVKCILGAVCARAEEGQEATIFKFTRRRWSDIDTLDRGTAELYKGTGAGEYYESRVKLLDVNKLFDALPHIDFLNLDVEGLDRKVLLALDLEKHRPHLILFEDNDTWGGSIDVREKLERSGYERLFVSGGSVCYAFPPCRGLRTQSKGPRTS